MTCICKASTAGRVGQIYGPDNKLAMNFHLDCEEHGIKVVADRPMRQVFRQGHVTMQQFNGLRSYTPARARRLMPNGMIEAEWVEWEFLPAEEATEIN